MPCAWVQVELVGRIADQTSSEGGALDTVGDVAQIAQQSRLVQEIAGSLVASQTLSQGRALDAFGQSTKQARISRAGRIG